MTWTTVDYDVALEVACHEGIVRQAYRDSVGAWTFSVGLTNATGHNVERYIDNPQPMQKCLEIYAWALNNYADAVRRAFVGHSLTKAQFAAALSFQWNTGAIERASWVRHFKAGDIARARKSFMDWRKPAEIIPRREKERDLFFDDKWANNGTITEYTRLTANYTPVWSSAKRVNIESDMRAVFGSQQPQQPQPPQPAPTQPKAPQTPQTGNAGSLLALAIMAALVGAAIWFFS